MEEWHGETLYSLTTQGNALALASAARPISRAKAADLVAGVVARAKSINSNPTYVYGVKEIFAFGSYVGSSPDLGDVDLAVDLFPKFSDPAEQQEACQRYCREAGGAGRRFRTSFDRIIAPRMDVFDTLKNKSKYISIHEASELAALPGVTAQIIFSEAPPRGGGDA